MILVMVMSMTCRFANFSSSVAIFICGGREEGLRDGRGEGRERGEGRTGNRP